MPPKRPPNRAGTSARPTLRLHAGRPAGPPPRTARPNTAQWLVNGFPATVRVWTELEWSLEEARPPGAQRYPSGAWALLSVD